MKCISSTSCPRKIPPYAACQFYDVFSLVLVPWQWEDFLAPMLPSLPHLCPVFDSYYHSNMPSTMVVGDPTADGKTVSCACGMTGQFQSARKFILLSNPKSLILNCNWIWIQWGNLFLHFYFESDFLKNDGCKSYTTYLASASQKVVSSDNQGLDGSEGIRNGSYSIYCSV